MYTVKDWRKRKMVLETPHTPYSIASYYTGVHKREMKHSFGDELLNNIHLLPDPLKKNLADSIITCDEPKQKPSKVFLNAETVDRRFPIAEERDLQTESPMMAPFSGITNFISGVFNVISGAMSQLRPRSPVKYYDCFDDTNVSRQGSPPSWQSANAEDRNKNERAHNLISSAETELKSDMNKDCRSAASQCEDKLNKVRLLLTSKPVEAPKFRSRRPRKVFVEPGSVEENFEDAFAPEDFVSLSNDPYIEYYSPFQYQREDLLQTDSPKMKTEVAPVHETTEIVNTLPALESNNKNCTSVKNDSINSESVNDVRTETVSNSNIKGLRPIIKVDEVVQNNQEVKQNNQEGIQNNQEGIQNNQEGIQKNKEDIRKNQEVVQNNQEVTQNKQEVIQNNQEVIQNKQENMENNKNTKQAGVNIKVEDIKEELVSSCEDKVSKLKALLQERRKKNRTITSSDSAPESLHETNETVQKPAKTVPIDKTQDKRFKNPHRRTDKRRKSKLKQNINEDMLFAHEIHSDDLSSVENSPSTNSLEDRLAGRMQNRIKRTSRTSDSESTPKATPTNIPLRNPKDVEYFNEISGKFHPASTDSDDSFQIVFTDSPKPRSRLASDCDSEDSFIVFEDSPDSCYTSNDVFGDDSDSDYTDSDSDVSDSGCISKLAPSLSRTIGDLTDDSLYDDKCVDEVDCAVRSVCEEIPSEDILDSEVSEEAEKESRGLLLTEAKKQLRKNQPPKKVQFSAEPPQVHVLRVWAFAARQARVGHWERYALDRDRFKRRIADVDMAVSWVLKPQHRSRVMFQRFMPWWNQLRRKELAEKKLKKEEEERRIAQEKEEEERRVAQEKEEEERRIAQEKEEEERRIAEEKLRIEEKGKDDDDGNHTDSLNDSKVAGNVCNGSHGKSGKDGKKLTNADKSDRIDKILRKNGISRNITRRSIKRNKNFAIDKKCDITNNEIDKTVIKKDVSEIVDNEKIPPTDMNDDTLSLHNGISNNGDVNLVMTNEKVSGT